MLGSENANQGILVTFLIGMTNYLTKATSRGKGLCWFPVLEISVHPGREGMALGEAHFLAVAACQGGLFEWQPTEKQRKARQEQKWAKPSKAFTP